MSLKMNYLVGGNMVECKMTITSILGTGSSATAHLELINLSTDKPVGARLVEVNVQSEEDFSGAYQQIKEMSEFEGATDF